MPRRGRHRTRLPLRLIAAVAALLVGGTAVVLGGSALAKDNGGDSGGSSILSALTGSSDEDSDLQRLVAKVRAGADFAITQLFLEPEGFLRLCDRLAAAGCEVPLLPGIMPLTTMRTLHRGPELSGAPLPPGLAEGLERYADDPKAFREAGMDLTTELCARLLAEGVGGLHFYTFNRSTATTELVQRLGLGARRQAVMA